MLALACCVPGRAHAQFTDSSFVRFELRGTSDVTNERFKEDSFDDTTFTGRKITGAPEYRNAMVAAMGAAGALPRGGRFLLRQEGTLGDHLVRGYTRLE